MFDEIIYGFIGFGFLIPCIVDLADKSGEEKQVQELVGMIAAKCHDEVLGRFGHDQEETARDPHRQLEQHVRHGYQRNQPAAAAARGPHLARARPRIRLGLGLGLGLR